MAAMPGSGLVSGKGSGYQTPPLHAARGPHRQCTASRPRAESLPSQQHQVLSQHVGQLGEKAASGGLQPTKPFARPQIGQVLGRAPGWPARPPSGRPGRRWNHVPAAAEPSISAAGADRPAPWRRLACCAGPHHLGKQRIYIAAAFVHSQSGAQGKGLGRGACPFACITRLCVGACSTGGAGGLIAGQPSSGFRTARTPAVACAFDLATAREAVSLAL